MSRLHRVVALCAPPLILLFSACYFANLFFFQASLQWWLASLGVLIILCGLAIQQGVQRMITLLFVTGGLIISLFTGFSQETFLGLAKMAPLVPLVALSPIAGFLFEHRPYGQNLLAATRRWVQSGLHMHGSLFALTHLMAGVVGLAGLAIVYPLLAKSIRNEADMRLVSISLLRGYCSTVFWAPTAPAMAFALDSLHVPFYTMLPIGLLLATVFLGVSLAVEYRTLTVQPSLPVGDTEVRPTILREFAVAMLLFVGGLLLAQHWTGLGLLVLVPIFGFLYTVTAFTALRELPALGQLLSRFWKTQLYRKSAESTAILATGFFLSTAELAGLDGVIRSVMASLGQGAGGLFLLALALIVMLLGALGASPTVTAVMLVGAIQGYALPVSPQLTIAAITVGVVTMQMLGPVVIPVFLMSSMSGAATLTIGIGWNLRFAFTQFAVTQLILQGLAWIL